MSQVITFVHPGKEQSVLPENRKKSPCRNANGWFRCGWSHNAHGRKFLEDGGEYVSADGKMHEAKSLCVWCEAEWDTMYRPLSVPPAPGIDIYPRRLHKLYPSIRSLTSGSMNSDPYIFGSQFIYSNCRQKQLAKSPILPGDIILFGSIKMGRNSQPRSFLLDTVFVASDAKFDVPVTTTLADIRKACKNRISDLFEKTVLVPLKSGNACATDAEKRRPIDFTLYFGASFHAKYQGMYSFAPIRVPGLEPVCGGDQGYPRLVLTPNNTSGKLRDAINFNINPRSGVSCKTGCDTRKVWEELVKFVFSRGYVCGTGFKEF